MGVVLQRLGGMGEEASDPRPEFSGLHPCWSRAASGLRGLRGQSFEPKEVRAGRGWTIVLVPPPCHWKTGPGLDPLWKT